MAPQCLWGLCIGPGSEQIIGRYDAHLGKVRLRNSLMKSWLPFCTGFTSGVCPGLCLCQVRFFFTTGEMGWVSTVVHRPPPGIPLPMPPEISQRVPKEL